MNKIRLLQSRRIIDIIVLLAVLAIGLWNSHGRAQAQGQTHSHSVPHPAHKATHMLSDDTTKDSSFDEFCTKLRAAAKKRDKQFVSEALSPEISMHIGGARGKKAFLEEWQELAQDSTFWMFLEKSLSHGAQYDSESQEFHAPAISFEDSHSDLPQCIGWNRTSTLRAKPELNATPIKTVFDEQLTMLEPNEAEPITAKWIKAKCKDGTVGYIDNADVYGAYDEFIVFARRNHRWCITWFGYAGL
jgi:hypothetical protein